MRCKQFNRQFVTRVPLELECAWALTGEHGAGELFWIRVRFVPLQPLRISKASRDMRALASSDNITQTDLFQEYSHSGVK
jgi:hypothetical protein